MVHPKALFFKDAMPSFHIQDCMLTKDSQIGIQEWNWFPSHNIIFPVKNWTKLCHAERRGWSNNLSCALSYLILVRKLCINNSSLTMSHCLNCNWSRCNWQQLKNVDCLQTTSKRGCKACLGDWSHFSSNSSAAGFLKKNVDDIQVAKVCFSDTLHPISSLGEKYLQLFWDC